MSGTVKTNVASSQIRINLVMKGLSSKGGTLWSVPITDGDSYQKLFQIIDKSLFLEGQKI